MNNITSKIKTIFGTKGDGNLLRYIAAICDNKRIESNAEKMVILGDLLFTYEVPYMILGGATNRIAMQIDGYAIKFAMDEQGYLDNLIEYSLSPELQPYVTKSYETNGYILIAECVEVINTETKWQYYKDAIKRTLYALCQDYLLGDVGYIKKNMTNWGIRDGRPVILDYAYCHRFTENLFVCGLCGSQLTYDENFDILMCTNRSHCKARYTYNDRKSIQGKKVDEDMVAERKARSIRLPEGIISKEVTILNREIIGDNAMLINSREDYYRFLRIREERRKMRLEISNPADRLDAMIALAKNPNDEDAKKVIFDQLGDDEEELRPIYTEEYQERYMNGGIGFRVYDAFGRDDSDTSMMNNGGNNDESVPLVNEDGFSPLDVLIMKARKKQYDKAPIHQAQLPHSPAKKSDDNHEQQHGGNNQQGGQKRDGRPQFKGKPNNGQNNGGKGKPNNNGSTKKSDKHDQQRNETLFVPIADIVGTFGLNPDGTKTQDDNTQNKQSTTEVVNAAMESEPASEKVELTLSTPDDASTDDQTERKGK